MLVIQNVKVARNYCRLTLIYIYKYYAFKWHDDHINISTCVLAIGALLEIQMQRELIEILLQHMREPLLAILEISCCYLLS